MRDSIDPHRVLQALGLREPYSGSEPVPGGFGGTLLWRTSVRDAGDVLLRVFPSGDATLVERERAAHEVARAGGVPAPEILAGGLVDGLGALAMRWMPGDTLAPVIMSQPTQAGALGRAAGATMALLHRQPFADPTGRDWIAMAGPYRDRLVHPLQQAILDAEMPVDRLIHLDFHPHNLLTDGTSITAVIDWANARSGPPLADLVRTRSILELALTAGQVPEAGRATVEQFLDGLRGAWEAEWDSIEPHVFDTFMVWASAVLVADLQPQVGRPGSWVTGELIDALGADCEVRLRQLEAGTG